MPVSFTSHKDEALRGLDQKMQKANEIIGGMAEGYAKGYAPVDTGNLRNSISHTAENNFRTVVIGTNVYYAPFQELGTSKIKAHPYLRPAIENHIKDYQAVLEQVMKG